MSVLKAQRRQLLLKHNYYKIMRQACIRCRQFSDKSIDVKIRRKALSEKGTAIGIRDCIYLCVESFVSNTCYKRGHCCHLINKPRGGINVKRRLL